VRACVRGEECTQGIKFTIMNNHSNFNLIQVLEKNEDKRKVCVCGGLARGWLYHDVTM